MTEGNVFTLSSIAGGGGGGNHHLADGGGGTPSQVQVGGTPFPGPGRKGTPSQVPGPGRGYPFPGPGRRVHLPRSRWGEGQHRVYLLRGRRCASCVDAIGLSCYFSSFKTRLANESWIIYGNHLGWFWLGDKDWMPIPCSCKTKLCLLKHQHVRKISFPNK